MRLNSSTLAIPPGWQFVPLKRITRFGYGEALAADDRDAGGHFEVFGSNGAFAHHSSANTLSPCIVIGRKGSYGKLQFSDSPVFAVDTTFVVDHRHTDNDLRFLFFALGILGLDELSDDVAVPGLSREKAYQALCPLPPFNVQQRIAAYLDAMTARIDALIATKRTLLERLGEKRQAIIDQAVTRGLNPFASIKDSGIDWLGAIPSHWTVETLGRSLVRIEQGWSPQCEERQKATAEWGVLRSGCVNGGIFRADDHKALPADVTPRTDLEVQPGDLLLCRASGSVDLIGSAAVISSCPPRLMFSDKTYRIRTQSGRVSPDFLALSLKSTYMRDQIVLSVSGAEGLANNIPQSAVKRYWFVRPPFHEQLLITSTIATSLATLEQGTRSIGSSIELAQEYRSALITAAVTGQIEGLR